MKVVRIVATPKKLAYMFMRMQEFYESPEFRGKVFTQEEFLEWYKTSKSGALYHMDWAGFNIPGWVVEVFRHGCFDPLTKLEKQLLKRCEGQSGAFYVIGVGSADMNTRTLKHEVSHALFYMCDKYRTSALEILDTIGIKFKLRFKRWLLFKGYHKKVHIDEMQAYLISDNTNQETAAAKKRLERSLNLYSSDIEFIDK